MGDAPPIILILLLVFGTATWLEACSTMRAIQDIAKAMRHPPACVSAQGAPNEEQDSRSR